MRIVGLAIIACLLCALKTNAYSADLDPDTLSVEAGYGRIVLPGTQVHLNATLTNGPGSPCYVAASARDSGDQFNKHAPDDS